jgi:molybdenum cofactor biosynthesis enzyme MoaA
MPSDGVELSPKDHILTDDEVIRLASLFVQHGVNKIRLTGGEPTIRKGITELVCESINPVSRFSHVCENIPG